MEVCIVMLINFGFNTVGMFGPDIWSTDPDLMEQISFHPMLKQLVVYFIEESKYQVEVNMQGEPGSSSFSIIRNLNYLKILR